MTWLVTGGAGYIGAHVVRELVSDPDVGDVVVLDDLSTGSRDVVPEEVPLVVGSVGDTDAVGDAIRHHGVTGVIHLAAKKSPSESVADPLTYWRENVGGMVSLLSACVANRVGAFVLSSSCSVYGTRLGLVDEDAPLAPQSPYGETKLACEQVLAAAAGAHGLSTATLRYFNVAGAGGPGLGDRGATNLVPMAFRAVESGAAPTVFGTDYATADGSCVRDYVHVLDLASAHVLAARQASDGGTAGVYNVGRGTGSSVLQVLKLVAEVSGFHHPPGRGPRRAGDPAEVVGDVRRIQADLGWHAMHDLRSMVESAWVARSGGAPGSARAG